MNFDQELKITERILKEVMDYPKEYFELPEEEFDKNFDESKYPSLRPVARLDDMFEIQERIADKEWYLQYEDALEQFIKRKYGFTFVSKFLLINASAEERACAVILMLDKMQEVKRGLEI